MARDADAEARRRLRNSHLGQDPREISRRGWWKVSQLHSPGLDHAVQPAGETVDSGRCVSERNTP